MGRMVCIVSMIRRLGTEHGGEKHDMVAGKPVRIYGESHRSHPKSGMRALSVKRVVNLTIRQRPIFEFLKCNLKVRFGSRLGVANS